MPGPPKQPTAKRILAGNPGKRALPKNEPKPPIASSDTPPYLTGLAVEIWNELAPNLASMGCLTVVDLRALATGCRLQALGETYASEVEMALTRIPVGTRPPPSPSLWAAAKCFEKAAMIFGRFGITPSERTKIHVEQPDDTSRDPIENIFRRRQNPAA